MGEIHPGFKKRSAVLLCLLFVAIAGLVGGAALSSVAESRYWAGPQLQGARLELSQYQDRITAQDSALGGVKETVHRCNQAAVPLRPGLAPFFADCDQMIVRYFQDGYGIDLSDRLRTLQIMEATYPEEVSEMVGGSHSGDFPGKLFLNSALLEDALWSTADGETLKAAGTTFSEKMLRTVYIHEIMHYLGFNGETGFAHLTEALAEALNQAVMDYGDVLYESVTGYAPIQGYAAQILTCDPELVRKALTEEGADLIAYFDSRLGDGYGAYYDALIGLVQNGQGKDRGRLKYYTQYLTYEYCKGVNPKAGELLRGKGGGEDRFFEVKWLLGLYSG